MKTPSATLTPALKTPPPDWPIYSFLFLLLGSSILPVEFISGMNAYFLILAVLVWFSKKREFPKSLLVFLSCFLIIIFIGFISGINNEIYPYFKDAWYFINPVIIIFVGYCLGAQTPLLNKALRILIIAGLILAFLHLSKFAVYPKLLAMQATEVRSIAGNGNFVVGLTCAFLLATVGRWRETLAISPILGWAILIICCTSMVLAYSRTLILVALVLWVALRGGMMGARMLKISVAAVLALAFLATLSTFLPKATEMDKKTFSGKLLRSAQELTISDYRDEQSINDNFRGFETARAFKSYADGGPLRWLGGRGFGHFIDLGVTLSLGEGPMRYIPILHNGIMYVLVKTGLFGLFIYLVCFGWIFRRGTYATHSTIKDEQFSGRIVQGTVAICLLTSWLIAGPFNKSSLVSVLLLLGFCLAIIERKELYK